ncbi:AAA+-type ATPase, SpoVK/Ycf46/Vps4 family [Halobacillus dabanensis]|uniref:AAA+-type ATPase, SpoVK/Ycf46/Vps4 family n=1 Tax=Halobacillus dabanensis TaxID=240302 RepID=A0A1I3YBW5_HALDA|nr:AAA family ATPase [Halobacillus dabanensis]SFK29312.1 AAA+-type ATPase, SpoVK/Ycf46/Vps4 family [Halobacillus dabanensis]
MLEQLKEWNSLEHPPPISEVEALRYMDEYEFEEKEGKALLYVILAYHRIKRHPGQDRLAEQFIDEAKVLDPNHPLVTELYESQQLLRAYTILKNTPLEQWVLHETDHDSAKAKKAKSIYSDVSYLIQQWDEELAHKTIIDASSRLKLYQDVYVELNDLLEILEDAISSIENRRIRIPVKEINDRTRRLSDNQDEIYKRLPTFLTDQSFQNPLEAFDHMVGLKDVKTYIRHYYHFLRYQQQRKSYGFSMVDEPGLHMIITGNPGTGKTTIARLLANIYHELGILDTKEVVEVNRSHLVGSYVGQSEENTMNYVKQAIGGVLFIDEAYSLKREGQTGNDYGQAVIDTLVSAMTSKDYGGKFAVILAGYPEEMRQFLWSNPGLRSRFPEQNHIELPDYQMEELLTIAEQTAMDNDFFFTRPALKEFASLIDKERVDESFGNARTVKNLVLKTVFQKGAQEAERDKHHWLDHMRISTQDLDWENISDDEVQSPMERLDELIGLTNVKEEVRKLSSFVQAQQKRKETGYPVVPIQLHSVFSGNPGTGKTTVADIYADVLKECGLLKRGHTVVVSRSDLVAGYVGQTAIKTKKKIREALGGVLFIDEAYSLYKGGRDDFGKEAIETLVDEMTKHNENLVVILAGYQREMEQLVESNPGLSSRFKKYFHFPDYTEDELIEMTHYQAMQYGYHFNEWAESFLLEKYRNHKTRGNGRFINNLVNEAIQFQAIRIMSDEAGDMNELKLEDLEKAWNMIRRES